MENFDFGKRLQNLMNEHDMKPVDIVKLSKQYDDSGKGLSKANLSQWINGTYKPKQQGIYILSRIFNVHPNYLMGYTDDPKYNHEELTQQVEVCDLINKCFGKQAYDIVRMYLTLNSDGKAAAFERMQELTQLEKYTQLPTQKKEARAAV